MFRNMVTSLVLHGQIKTTEARAKELRRHAERLISIGKRAPQAVTLEQLSGAELERAKAQRVTAIRRIRRVVHSDDAVRLLMGEYADRYRERPGGYTRVLKLGRPRPGDNARMAVIALVTESLEEKAKAQPPRDESAGAAVADDAEVAQDDAADAAEATSDTESGEE